MDRRSALRSSAGAFGVLIAGGILKAKESAVVPILDSHIHLFDPNRPQGVPVVVPGSATTQTGSFPEAYRQWAEPLGVLGAIHIEASNWVEDNLWALQVARSSDLMVGVVGNLDPEKSEFESFLERFHRDPLFRGIRYGNIWGYDLARGSRDGNVIGRLRRLAEYGLVMDTATPGIELLNGILRINDAIPQLSIVVDHLPSFDPSPAEEASYERILREIAERPTIYVKLSEVVHVRHGMVSTRMTDYRDALDRITAAFGEDRILFGSDYPTSDMVTTPQQVFQVARDYISARSRTFQEKLMFRNAWRIYHCQARTEAQRRNLDV